MDLSLLVEIKISNKSGSFEAKLMSIIVLNGIMHIIVSYDTRLVKQAGHRIAMIKPVHSIS